MPFKRKARILFASATPYPASVAERYANRAVAEWLIAFAAAPRCSGNSVDVNEVDNTCLVLADTLRLELDLVITLDEQVISRCPDWPSAVRRRHHPISMQGLALNAEIQGLIDGIIGGFKLLEKSAAE